jgi:hypothetical protein
VVVVVVRSVVVKMNEEKRKGLLIGGFLLWRMKRKKEREGLMVRVYGMRNML